MDYELLGKQKSICSPYFENCDSEVLNIFVARDISLLWCATRICLSPKLFIMYINDI